MNRRIAVRSGLLAGLVAAALAGPFEATAGAQDAQVVQALKDVEGALRRLEADRNAHWGQVRRVQEQQRIFLKAWHRYPQVIEIGLRVWEGLIEWRQSAVNLHLALALARAASSTRPTFMYSSAS